MGRLIVHRALRFSRLKELTGLTAGNLATHLEALRRADYVVETDALLRSGPGKIIAITPQGRVAFETYVRDLEAFLRDLQALAPDPGLANEVRDLFPELGKTAGRPPEP